MDNRQATNLLLIDAAYLNYLIGDVKHNFERIIGRALPPLDLVGFMVRLAMDAGVSPGNDGMDVIFVSEDSDCVLSDASPSKLEAELDGNACKSEIGEVTFTLASAAGMVPLDGLTVDVARNCFGQERFRRVMTIVPDATFAMMSEMLDIDDRRLDLVRFEMQQRERLNGWKVETLLYAMLAAFGVRSEELD